MVHTAAFHPAAPLDAQRGFFRRPPENGQPPGPWTACTITNTLTLEPIKRLPEGNPRLGV
ncbi:MAG: hypothetical protein U5K99_01115 [Anaerolineales bacterium]|nr:hypothetical protein [Anaerolineales bacterium]